MFVWCELSLTPLPYSMIMINSCHSCVHRWTWRLSVTQRKWSFCLIQIEGTELASQSASCSVSACQCEQRTQIFILFRTGSVRFWTTWTQCHGLLFIQGKMACRYSFRCFRGILWMGLASKHSYSEGLSCCIYGFSLRVWMQSSFVPRVMREEIFPSSTQ